MKYRKKPVEIEAIKWNGDNLKEVLDFSKDAYLGKDDCTLFIETLEGDMKASIGDYIIKGVNGEFYPCKPDIFEKTYDKADVKNYIGSKVKNKNSGKIGVVLRITDSGSVQVLESINPYVINTHDNWNTLEIIND